MRKRTRLAHMRSPFVAARVLLSAGVLASLILGAAFPDRPVAYAADAISRAQLLPAALRLRAAAASDAGLAVFPALLALTFLFGRGYCSALCPLGALQDLALFLRGRAAVSSRGFRAPRSLLRAASLMAVAGLWLLGSSAALAILEPYSVVSRVLAAASGLFAGGPPAPLEAAAPAAIGPATPAPQRAFPVGALSAAFLASILAVAALKGRLFCNTLCPAGALLSVPAGRSVFGVRLDAERCTSCGACERVCPAGCIDGAHRRLYGGSCVLCLSCLPACPHGALRYALHRRG